MHVADLSWLAPRALVVTPAAVPRADDGRADLSIVAAGAPMIFESAQNAPGTGRYSYAVLGTSGRLTYDGITTRLTGRGGTSDLGPDVFAAIDAVTAALDATPDHPRPDGGPDFVGGLAGAWAYDLGRLIEALPGTAAADRAGLWMDLRVVTDLLVVDHLHDRTWRIRRPLRDDPDDPDDILDGLPRRVAGDPVAPPAAPTVMSTLGRDAYLAAIERVGAAITAGEVFQVNLSQRLTCPWPAPAAQLYRRLQHASPAPYAALLQQDRHRALVSISPECFLAAEGRRVTTRPIKGTRPRGEDAAADVAAGRALTASAKDRAENVMVVDMQRNDLGRVCRPGTVQATSLLVPERHPTVWHLVSTVEGQLRPDVGWGQLLRASFPSGSVTGAPKVRAMTLIDRLEPVRRSWYCGSIGWLGPGSASLSVAIRTAVVHDGLVDYAAGGGIVADSDPHAEVAESWAKAAAFLQAVGAVPHQEVPA